MDLCSWTGIIVCPALNVATENPTNLGTTNGSRNCCLVIGLPSTYNKNNNVKGHESARRLKSNFPLQLKVKRTSWHVLFECYLLPVSICDVGRWGISFNDATMPLDAYFFVNSSLLFASKGESMNCVKNPRITPAENTSSSLKRELIEDWGWRGFGDILPRRIIFTFCSSGIWDCFFLSLFVCCALIIPT